MLATGAHAGSTRLREITACYRSPVPLINRTQHPLRRSPPPSPAIVGSLVRLRARALACRAIVSRTKERRSEVRYARLRRPSPSRRAAASVRVRRGRAMDRLSALTQRLVPSDSFDPAGPGLAVKECWAVTSRHCQWRSRSE